MAKAWSTKNEINYLDGLVSGKWRHSEVPIEALLKNYIKSAKHRVMNDTFGDVNGSDVIKHAQGLLEA